MEVKSLPPIVQEWMQKIEENVTTDQTMMERYCDMLEQYADESGEGFLRGYSLFYRGLSHYLSAQLDKGMEALSAALNYLMAAKAWGMAAHTYNTMGSIADFQGDVSLAIDCYVKSLALAKEHGSTVVEYDVRSNIASIYISLGAYEDAANMLEECKFLMEQGLELPLTSQFVSEVNIANCYIHTGELSKAEDSLNWLRETINYDLSALNQLLIIMLESQLYHATGDYAARDAAIARLETLDMQSMDVYYALPELCYHAMLLLEVGKLEEFLSLVSRIETLASSPNAEKRILDLRLKYYKKTGDEEKLAEMAMKYYEVATLRETEQSKIVSHNIITRMRLDEEESRRKEVEHSNLQLKQKSERDALTGLNNRYKFNELAELAFHKAHLNSTPLTVEILDIDCYKEFNDNYGHQAGDDCLVRIAEVIRSLEEFNGVHTARYGGDEFVVIYEEYSPEDVEKMAQRLRDRISALNIKHKGSSVSDRITISQGLFHSIPTGGNKLWDFLYYADMALYGVKKRGRNAYYVGTSFKEVRQYSSEKASSDAKK